MCAPVDYRNLIAYELGAPTMQDLPMYWGHFEQGRNFFLNGYRDLTARLNINRPRDLLVGFREAQDELKDAADPKARWSHNIASKMWTDKVAPVQASEALSTRPLCLVKALLLMAMLAPRARHENQIRAAQGDQEISIYNSVRIIPAIYVVENFDAAYKDDLSENHATAIDACRASLLALGQDARKIDYILSDVAKGHSVTYEIATCIRTHCNHSGELGISLTRRNGKQNIKSASENLTFVSPPLQFK